MINRLLKVDKLHFCVNELVGGTSNFNYFVDLQDISDMNATFDIVKEVRLDQGKASISIKITDKKSVIWGVRSIFKDMMEVG